jgi:flagellar basal body-associated protein FliL
MAGKIFAGSALTRQATRGKKRRLWRTLLVVILACAVLGGSGYVLLTTKPWTLAVKPQHQSVPAASVSPSPPSPPVVSSQPLPTAVPVLRKEIGPITCRNKTNPRLAITLSLRLAFTNPQLGPELSQKEDYLKVLTQLALANCSLEAVEASALRDTLLRRYNSLLKSGPLQDLVFTQFSVDLISKGTEKK